MAVTGNRHAHRLIRHRSNPDRNRHPTRHLTGATGCGHRTGIQTGNRGCHHLRHRTPAPRHPCHQRCPFCQLAARKVFTQGKLIYSNFCIYGHAAQHGVDEQTALSKGM